MLKEFDAIPDDIWDNPLERFYKTLNHEQWTRIYYRTVVKIDDILYIGILRPLEKKCDI